MISHLCATKEGETRHRFLQPSIADKEDALATPISFSAPLEGVGAKRILHFG